jgi:tetratricopeptide (TPR) repeat protein
MACPTIMVKNNTSQLDAFRKLLQSSDLRQDEDANKIIDGASSISNEEDKDLALLMASEALSSAGQWDKAQAAARLIGGPQEKTDAHFKIAGQLIAAGQTERALEKLREARELAERIEEPWQKAELLFYIAKLLTGVSGYANATGVWQQAIKVARLGQDTQDVQSSLDCSSVLAEIALSLATQNEMTQAIDVARAIKNTWKRGKVLEAIETR